MQQMNNDIIYANKNGEVAVKEQILMHKLKLIVYSLMPWYEKASE